MKEKKNKSYDKTKSRKWNLVLLVFWMSALALLAPPLLSVWVFGAKAPLVILSGTEFVSLITLAVSAYFGANVFQRHVELKNGVYSENIRDANVEDVAEKDKEKPKKEEESDEGKEA